MMDSTRPNSPSCACEMLDGLPRAQIAQHGFDFRVGLAGVRLSVGIALGTVAAGTAFLGAGFLFGGF